MASQAEHYGLTGRKRYIQKNIWDLGMCFDKREKSQYSIHICKTPCAVPQYYLMGCCFPCCVAFNQREMLLSGRMYEEYSCCQGKYGKCWCNNLAKEIPHCCLFAEVLCCTGCAIGGNRFYMSEKYMIKDRLSETIILVVASILGFLGLFGAILGCYVNGVLNSQQENHFIEAEGQTSLVPYFRWKEGNQIWSLDKCEPCCGDPCNPLDGLKCFAWWCCPCCSLCTMAKFFASSLDQECTILEHCVPYLFAVLCSSIFPVPILNMIPWVSLNTGRRHNIRGKDGTGDERHFFGDCLIANTCIAPCGICQELRTQPVESWDWVAQMQKSGFPEMGNLKHFTLFRNDLGRFSGDSKPSGSGHENAPVQKPKKDESDDGSE